VRPIQQVLPGALVEIMRAAPLSAGKVDLAWRAAVGSAVERVTAVRLEGRVLLVEAASPAWAREVLRASPVILARLQTLLGKDTIASLTVREL
jgi:predicted nucleic acid-binding Zn ribbon protein